MAIAVLDLQPITGQPPTAVESYLAANDTVPDLPFLAVGMAGVILLRRSKRARRLLSTSEPSACAPAFGCSACSGFTSTQAMSRRCLSTSRERASMSLSV